MSVGATPLLGSSLAFALTACVSATPKSTSNASLPASLPATQAVLPRAQEPAIEPDAADAEQDQVIEVEPLRIQVLRDDEGNERVVATDARSIFDEGNDALATGDFERALALYDELLADFADSRLAAPTLYNAGLALEGLERVDDAVRRYLQLAALDSKSSDGIDARIRAASLYAEHERWNESLAVLDALVALKTLSVSDELEAKSRRGYVLLEAKDYSGAELALTEAIAFHAAKAAGGQVFEGDYYLGMAHFYFGEVARRQFDAIPIRLPESQMQRDVEAKAGLVMLASDRFGDTVELGNIYWATAAGFRLADMQGSFWRELVSAPIPPHLNEQAAGLYVVEVHRSALSLLEKSLSIHGKNVQLATLYKSETPWSQASAAEAVRLTEVIGREQAGSFLTGEELSASMPRMPASSGDYIPGRIEL